MARRLSPPTPTPRRPDAPKGAYTAARAAHEQGVPISTISFGTPDGTVDINGMSQPVPVDNETMVHVASVSGGSHYDASSVAQLKGVYTTLQQQIGYQTVPGEASIGWLRLATLVLALAAFGGILINRRVPS
jgi:Ca-activated chloride channel homolog